MLNVLIYENNNGIKNTLKYIFYLKGFNCIFTDKILDYSLTKTFDLVFLGINNENEIDEIIKFKNSEIVIASELHSKKLLDPNLLKLNYNILTKPILLNKLIEIIDNFLSKKNINASSKLPEHKILNVQDYHISKKIFENKFFINYLGIDKNGKKLFIKKLNNIDKNSYSIFDFFQEALLDINSNNTSKIIDFNINNTGFYIIYDYINGKNLKEINESWKYKIKTNTKFWIDVTIKVLDILKIYHSKNIYHSNIKPNKIIIEFNDKNKIDYKNPNVKLIGYGNSIIKESKIIKKSRPFSLLYSPPEQVLKKYNLINETTDIYELGLTLYELITGSLPFNNCNPLKTLAYQLNKNIPKNRKINNDLFIILQKATYKYVFPKPHTHYNSKQIEKMLILGQEKRYKSVNDFKTDLINYLNKN